LLKRVVSNIGVLGCWDVTYLFIKLDKGGFVLFLNVTTKMVLVDALREALALFLLLSGEVTGGASG
jgi:hypothetical protein